VGRLVGIDGDDAAVAGGRQRVVPGRPARPGLDRGAVVLGAAEDHPAERVEGDGMELDVAQAGADEAPPPQGGVVGVVQPRDPPVGGLQQVAVVVEGQGPRIGVGRRVVGPVEVGLRPDVVGALGGVAAKDGPDLERARGRLVVPVAADVDHVRVQRVRHDGAVRVHPLARLEGVNRGRAQRRPVGALVRRAEDASQLAVLGDRHGVDRVAGRAVVHGQQDARRRVQPGEAVVHGCPGEAPVVAAVHAFLAGAAEDERDDRGVEAAGVAGVGHHGAHRLGGQARARGAGDLRPGDAPVGAAVDAAAWFRGREQEEVVGVQRRGQHDVAAVQRRRHDAADGLAAEDLRAEDLPVLTAVERATDAEA
jgi:hypothetical protein